ncbi:hypothetical protein [Clostridium faecium]|uniref:Uncharacterized protein n=1 Tax=Clostridium faecium TaxID=2762223 RepID=A0ABR8YNS5_9CLOT|nr:hypothetical protein [Clostridium faecium]MBD8045846.1 hypothetical protein [Clostridium faecium]
MGTIKKVIIFVFGMLITIAFITDGFGYFSKSMEMSKSTKTGFDSLSQKLTSASYSDYDNTVVKGSEAINAIRLYAADNFTVTVKTKRSSKSYNDSIYNVSNISDTNYIEPTGKFESKLGVNENGTVNSITLTQVK